MIERGIGLLIGFTIAYLLHRYAHEWVWGKDEQ